MASSVAAFFITYHKFRCVILQKTRAPLVSVSVFRNDVYFNFKTNDLPFLGHRKHKT